MGDTATNPTTNAATEKLSAFYTTLTTQAEIKAGDIVQYKSGVPRPDRDLRQGAPGIVTYVYRNPPTNGPGGAKMEDISGFAEDSFVHLYAIDTDGDLVKCKIPVLFLEPYTGGVEIQNTSKDTDLAGILSGLSQEAEPDDEPNTSLLGGMLRRIRH